jgi:ADP-heptose:LPS heptosyltransferase
MKIPSNWTYRANPKRVVIHPSSANPWKNWPQKKFIALAKRLQEDGFMPQFTLPSAEAAEWNPLLEQAGLPKAISTDWMSLTQFIYESGFLIGNDASAGHLASSLFIPTLSIFDRKSRAIFWRPGWGYSQTVLPPKVLFGRSLIKALWKRALSVGRVYRSFKKLSIG